jgi:PTH1 family peptidyl-tRNA hydrolase
MIAIFGLGNPGSEYENTRHNLGFASIDLFWQKFSDVFSNFSEKKEFNGQISEGMINNNKIILIKPLTYMNESGQSVQKIKNFYKLDNKDIWILHDDLDLPPGKIKISINSSAGGHNGIASIINQLNSKDFVRFRIGIGRPGLFGSVTSFVLKKPSAKEINEISTAQTKIITALESALTDGLPKTQSIYNQ